jgi:hypothetical protein
VQLGRGSTVLLLLLFLGLSGCSIHNSGRVKGRGKAEAEERDEEDEAREFPGSGTGRGSERRMQSALATAECSRKESVTMQGQVDGRRSGLRL